MTNFYQHGKIKIYILKFGVLYREKWGVFVEKKVIRREISDHTIKTHAVFIFAVCILFGSMQLFRGNWGIGGATVTMGVIVPLVSLVFMRGMENVLRGTFLTQATVIVIVVLSSTQGELHSMFPLLVGNVAIGSIYYDTRNINLSWILTDIAILGAIPFKSFLYMGAGMGIILKGVVGVNVGAFMIKFLLNQSFGYIQQAEEAAARADELLQQVSEQMEETRVLNEKQTETVQSVVEISATLENSSSIMRDISGQLSDASQEQASAVSEIHQSIERFSVEAGNCADAARQAADLAIQSVEVIQESSEDIRKMVRAMEEVNETSSRISRIIKTIDDISFQTNILALNAAVEAARAGAAGTGFAVVADEVRSLANKSAEAAKDTAELINESLNAIQGTTKLAQTAESHMVAVMDCSRNTESHAREIAQLVEQQRTIVDEIRGMVDTMSQVIERNAQTAEESANISGTVSGEVERMRAIIT